MIVIRVLGGRLSKSGELTLLTVLKLQLVLILAARLQAKGIPYRYVFPQGRPRVDEIGQRPCDAMSLWVLKRDLYCSEVNVPVAGEDLVTRQERLNYVSDVAKRQRAKVFRQRDLRKVNRLSPPSESTGVDDPYLSEIGADNFRIRP